VSLFDAVIKVGHAPEVPIAGKPQSRARPLEATGRIAQNAEPKVSNCF
jgi:hypothetical protein